MATRLYHSESTVIDQCCADCKRLTDSQFFCFICNDRFCETCWTIQHQFRSFQHHQPYKIEMVNWINLFSDLNSMGSEELVQDNILVYISERPVIYLDFNAFDNYLLEAVISTYLEITTYTSFLSHKRYLWRNLLQLMIYFAIHLYPTDDLPFVDRYQQSQYRMKDPSIQTKWQQMLASVYPNLMQEQLLIPDIWKETIEGLIVIINYYQPKSEDLRRDQFFGRGSSLTYCLQFFRQFLIEMPIGNQIILRAN